MREFVDDGVEFHNTLFPTILVHPLCRHPFFLVYTRFVHENRYRSVICAAMDSKVWPEITFAIISQLLKPIVSIYEPVQLY